MSEVFAQSPFVKNETGLPGELSRLLSRRDAEPVILLRSLPSEFDASRDDVDLLLTAARREQLLHDALEAATAGRLNFSVRQNGPDKVRLTLWSIDTSTQLAVDLWEVFNQCPAAKPQKRLSLPAQLFTNVALTPAADLPGAWRLPADLEFCLLVLHLSGKQKSLRCPVTRKRLIEARHRLLEANRPGSDLAALQECANRLSTALQILPEQVHECVTWLRQQLAGTCNAASAGSAQRFARKRRQSFSNRWRLFLGSRVPVLAITGSDGVGKSAVVSELNRMQPRRMQPCKAKKLYRRSLTYQLLAAVVQSAAGWTMETLDDRIAPLLALRSAMALWPRVLLRLLFGSPVAVITGAGIATLVLDRSPAGVLLTHRKDLQPRQMTGTRWLERLLPPQTTVLLTLPFERLTARRVEMKTSDSHECYQRLLLQQALRSQPVELIVLNAADSVHLLARRVLRLLDDGTLEAKDTPTPAAASPSRSAPATTVKQPARRQRGEAA